MTEQTVPERGVPLTAETVCLLQPGDWLLHPVHGVVRYWAPLADEMYVKDGPFTFLGRPDADGWIAHDGGENPAPGLEVITRTRIATAPCSAKSEWCDWAVVIAWCPHVAVAAAPALSTAETVVVPVEAAEYARLLVQELTPDQGQSASRAFGLALGLQSAIAATPGSSALCADLNSYVTRCIRSTPEASMSLEESLIARAAKALSAAPAREPEGGAVGREIARMREVERDWRRPALAQVEGPNDLKIYGGTIADDIDRWADLLAALTPKEAPAATGAGEDEAAKLLWNRFAVSHHESWAEEPNKAEYRLAAADVLALRAQPQAREEAQPVGDDATYYGKDCPVGMVQVEFVGCSPSERYSDYGWKPTKSAFIELYVDGLRYRIDAGDIGHNCFDGKPRRGVHISYPMGAELGDRSMNALNLANPGSELFWRPSPTTPPTQPLAEGVDAEKLFKALRDESWDLRCFNVPTGGDDCDIGWRVVGHWQAEPCERTIAEVFSDDPAEAVRQALAALQQEGR